MPQPPFQPTQTEAFRYSRHVGNYASPAELPNTAGASVQTPRLKEGSIAFALSDSSLYMCTSAVEGAASWVSAVASAGSLPRSTLPAIATALTTAAAFERIRYDASGGTFTINAPASPQSGDRFGTKEVASDPTVITVSGNGNDIEHPLTRQSAATAVFGRTSLGVEWEYDGTQWRLIDSTGPIELLGTIAVGDIGVVSGALAVTGDIISASASSGVSDTTVTINFPTLPGTPTVFVQVTGLGVPTLDNDIDVPIPANLTASSFTVFFEEQGAVVQNLVLEVRIVVR